MAEDEVILIGNWNEAEELLALFVDNVDETIENIIREYLEEKREEFEAYIEQDVFGLAPLSDRYLRWKLSKGLDPRTLIATGTYLAAIKLAPVDIGGWGIGILHGEYGDNGQPLKAIGEALEYGTSRMPPRPHWRPMAELIQDEFPDYLMNRLEQIWAGAGMK